MNYSLLKGLNDSDQKKISSKFEKLIFEKKELIYTKKGEKTWFFDNEEKRSWVYFIKSWIVKIVVEHEGRKYTIAFLKKWDFFGEQSSILWFDPCADVVAISDVKIDFLNSIEFNKTMNEFPVFSMNVVKYLANRIQALSWTIFNHVFRSLESRVASSILDLFYEFWEEKCKNKCIISIKVTHKDLSDFIWTNRETVTKILNQFKNRWLIDFIDRKILITNLTKLKAIAKV